MSDRLEFSAGDVLKGRVDVESVDARYVLLRGGLMRTKMFIEALNYVAKFGWRAVGFTQGYVLLERVE